MRLQLPLFDFIMMSDDVLRCIEDPGEGVDRRYYPRTASGPISRDGLVLQIKLILDRGRQEVKLYLLVANDDGTASYRTMGRVTAGSRSGKYLTLETLGGDIVSIEGVARWPAGRTPTDAPCAERTSPPPRSPIGMNGRRRAPPDATA